MVDDCAVFHFSGRADWAVVGTIIDIVLVINQTDTLNPVPSLISPLRVSGVASVSSKSSTNVEETAVRDGVLVVISGIESKDLPFESPTA